MMMFWVDESAEVTADEDAAMMIAVKSWVEQMTERGVMGSLTTGYRGGLGYGAGRHRGRD
jgi:hypothetical protein